MPKCGNQCETSQDLLEIDLLLQFSQLTLSRRLGHHLANQKLPNQTLLSKCAKTEHWSFPSSTKSKQTQDFPARSTILFHSNWIFGNDQENEQWDIFISNLCRSRKYLCIKIWGPRSLFAQMRKIPMTSKFTLKHIGQFCQLLEIVFKGRMGALDSSVTRQTSAELGRTQKKGKTFYIFGSIR